VWGGEVTAAGGHLGPFGSRDRLSAKVAHPDNASIGAVIVGGFQSSATCPRFTSAESRAKLSLVRAEGCLRDAPDAGVCSSARALCVP